MKEILVEDLRPGDVLHKPVFGRGGIVMLEAGTVLTGHYIERLRTLGYRHIPIAGRGGASGDSLPKKQPERKAEEGFDASDIARMKEDPEAMKRTEEMVHSFLESDRTFANLALASADLGRLRRGYRERVLETFAQRALAEELSVLRQTDPQWFGHALNVSLLANVAGDARGGDGAQLQELTVGALLFDIGMTRLPAGLIRARRKWTDAERRQVREHTHLGYRVLSGIRDVPLQAARCALLHHERYNGEGYPLAFKGKDIPELAQIVGLADVYDALLSSRHHREPYPNNEAMEYLFAAGNYEFGMEIIHLFLRHIAVIPVSSVVLLSSGQLGVVVSADRRMAHRPVVRVIREANGDEVAKPYTIDLSDQRRLVVVKTVPGGDRPL